MLDLNLNLASTYDEMCIRDRTLFEEETKPELEGFEKGQESELGAVNVMTGIYTGRSPKDKFIVKMCIRDSSHTSSFILLLV